MALIKCGECSREISDQATACVGCGAPVSSSKKAEPAEYFVLINGQEEGPFTTGQIRDLWTEMKVAGDTLFARPGMAEWKPLITIQKEIFGNEPPKPANKKCTFCAEEISLEALKCKHCGASLSTRVLQSTAQPKDPLLMAIASGCCLAGLGQILLGQVTKGIVFLILCLVIGSITGGIAALVLWPVMGIDAYMVAKKLKNGQPVSEWEFFPQS
jgi:hypothetical protein